MKNKRIIIVAIVLSIIAILTPITRFFQGFELDLNSSNTESKIFFPASDGIHSYSGILVFNILCMILGAYFFGKASIKNKENFYKKFSVIFLILLILFMPVSYHIESGGISGSVTSHFPSISYYIYNLISGGSIYYL